MLALLYGGMTCIAGVLGSKQVALGPLAVEAGIFPFLLLVSISSTVAQRECSAGSRCGVVDSGVTRSAANQRQISGAAARSLGTAAGGVGPGATSSSAARDP